MTEPVVARAEGGADGRAYAGVRIAGDEDEVTGCTMSGPGVGVGLPLCAGNERGTVTPGCNGRIGGGFGLRVGVE